MAVRTAHKSYVQG